MAAPDRPDWRTFIAFNAEPNSGVIPVWTEMGRDVAKLTPQLVKFSELARGRQYELGETMATQPTFTFRDPNEYLNQANTASPYYPNVQPYRELLHLAIWPNDGAGNLLNANTWEQPYDTSFESYTAGVTPGWVTKLPTYLPGTAATVTTTNPQQGTKSLTYPLVTGDGVAAGITLALPCVPGQQHTVSAYVRQSSAGTQILSVNAVEWQDVFARTLAASWGSADIGGAYTNTGGVAGNYSVTSDWGLHAHSTINTWRRSVLGGANVLDFDVTVLTGVSSSAGAGSAVIERRVDANNLVRFGWESNGDELDVLVEVVTAGVVVASNQVVTEINYEAERSWFIRATAEGTQLTAYLWASDMPEASAVTATVASGAQPQGTLALASFSAVTTPSFRWADLRGVGYLAGATTTTTTGAYARIACTFAATQPLHQLHLTTLAASVTGTVNVDAIMHELGAAATTYDDEGAVVYPMIRAHAERYTRTWGEGSQGFEGWCEIPAVDALAALNAITLVPELPSAIAATYPTYWWRLAGGGDIASFPDSGALGVPNPLVFYESKYGAGIELQAGAATSIVGDPGGTGVKFEQEAGWAGAGNAAPGTALMSVQPVAFPSIFGTSWVVSASLWITIPEGALTDFGSALAAMRRPTSVYSWIPISIQLDSTSHPLAAIQDNLGNFIIANAADPINDGLPHHLAAVVYQDATDTEVRIYVDGVLVDTTIAATSTVGGLWTGGTQATNVAVGSGPNAVNPTATLSDVAFYDRELLDSEIVAIWDAGATGHAGETPGQRIEGHLAAGGYVGGQNITLGSTSTMQAPTWQGSIDLLTDTQQNTTVEGGTLWVAPDGEITMEGRAVRWLRLTPRFTLGEDAAGGEVPYLGSVGYDYDPQFIYADVTVERNGGAKTAGGLPADVAVTRRRFYPRSYSTSGDYGDDPQAQDQADWIFYGHSAASLRVFEVAIDPASNPSLWHFCLSVEVGNRVTVKRRAKAANAGAGIVMSADFFVETVKHRSYEAKDGTFYTVLLLSPATPAPGVVTQPWILGDSTWSVLDSTTIPGY